LFCPNCGTKNTETATSCTKCGFNVKGAAAPKFKGTMLMMNQPAAKPAAAPAPTAGAPAAPVPAAAAAPAPVSAAAHAPETKPKPVFKGTMVGVAPPGGFLASPPGAPAPAAAAPATTPFGSPAAAPAPQAPAAAPGFAAPQHPPFGGAVNPLGGTVALPSAPAAYGLPVGNPLGTPAQGVPMGAPPGAFPTPGAMPPGAMPGQPPPGWGPPPGQQPPPGWGPPPGQQPPPGWGPPPGQQPPPGWGAPPYGPPPDATLKSQGAAQFGAPGAPGMVGDSYSQQGVYPMQPGYPGAMMPGMGAPMGAVGVRGKMRNPIACLLLAFFTCGIYGLIAAWTMMNELKAYLGKPEIVPWHILIPVYNLIVLIVKLPAWVTEAKQRAGSRNPMSAGPLLYLLLGLYFLPKDLNEVWDPSLQ
jgi:hypothetical protein